MKNHKVPLPWEKLSDCRFAHLVNTKIKNIRGVSYKVAWLKILDVSRLSAKFDGELLLFEPQVLIFIETNENIDFLGIYNASEPEEDCNLSVPSFCLRRCSWSRERRHRAFKKSDLDFINDYLLGEEQIQSRITFWDWKEFPELESTLQDFIAMFRNGLVMEKCYRPDRNSKIRYINCTLVKDCMSSEVSYSLLQNQCIELENIIPKFFQTVDSLESEPIFIPDRDYSLRISYRSSLEHYLNIFQAKTKP